MKNLLLLLLAVVPLHLKAQTDQTLASDTNAMQDKFKCRHLEIIEDDKIFILSKDVEINLENLSLSAELAVYDSEKKIIVAYKPKTMVFKGEAIISEKPQDIVRYTIGDNVIYVD